MANIDEFNRLTLYLLDGLFEAFPMYSIFKIEDFFDHDPQPHDLANFEGTMDFLRDEGFIIYAQSAEARIYIGVKLTMQGLAVLNAVPDTVAGTSVITRIKSALGTASTEAFKETVKVLVGVAVGRNI